MKQVVCQASLHDGMGWGSKESKSLISFGQGFRVDRLGAGDGCQPLLLH